MSTHPSHSRVLLLAECETQIQQLLWKKRTRLQSDLKIERDIHKNEYNLEPHARVVHVKMMTQHYEDLQTDKD